MWRTMWSGGRGLIPLGAVLLIACGGELPSKQPGTVLSSDQDANPFPEATLWVVVAGDADVESFTCNLLVI